MAPILTVGASAQSSWPTRHCVPALGTCVPHTRHKGLQRPAVLPPCPREEPKVELDWT